MRITEDQPDVRLILAALRAEHRRQIRKVEIQVTHKVSRRARTRLQQKVRSVGLGRLANAIGHTSALLEQNLGPQDKPYGVIFAKGGDETLAGGALEAYSRGSLITPKQGEWLAYPTKAVPAYVSLGGRRFKTTPQLYNASGLVRSIGKLIFRQISASRAVLLIERVTVSPKTGRAAADRGRRTRTRIREDAVVAFILIRNTRRQKRFDKDIEIGAEAATVPDELARALEAVD